MCAAEMSNIHWLVPFGKSRGQRLRCLNVFDVQINLILIYREELRGVSRGKDVKDVDWSKVAASLVDLDTVSVTQSAQAERKDENK